MDRLKDYAQLWLALHLYIQIDYLEFMKAYHVTVNGLLPQIEAHGLVPGSRSPYKEPDEGFMQLLGDILARKAGYIPIGAVTYYPSSCHIYVWNNLQESIGMAKTVPDMLDKRLFRKEEKRKPIILEIEVEDERVTPDPASTPHGIMIEGVIHWSSIIQVYSLDDLCNTNHNSSDEV